IGTPPRPFNLLVDSGSGDMWVGSESCRSDSGGGCGDHQLLGKKSSSSFQATDTPWSITYGKGAVSGRLARDHVVFPGRMRVENHTFGIAHNESAQFTSNESPLDGVLGCGKQSLAMQPTWTFLNALKAHGLIQNRTISYKISRIKDGDNDGEMTIGGMDHTKYDSGTLVEVPNVNKGGFWEASLDRIRVNQKDLGLHNRSCIFDTGTTLFVAPEPDVEVIHRTIPGAVFNDTTSSWALPCNTTTVISLGFGGKSFAIASEDLVLGPLNGTGMAMCASSIVQGGVEAGPMHWLVGDVWLKNVYISMKEDEDLISIARPR
ncbi:aspartic peptidase domain-containing protein, partial [Mycena amicta]